MKKEKILGISVSKILCAANKSEEIKKVMEDLFPELFSAEKVFCQIGDILKRKDHVGIYAVVNIDHKVQLLNITYGSFFKAALSSYALKNPYDKITVGEFRQLSNTMNGEEEFTIFYKHILIK